MFARLFGSGTQLAPDGEPPAQDRPLSLAVQSNMVAEANGDLFKFFVSDTAEVASKFYLTELNVTAKIIRLTATAEEERVFRYVMCIFSSSGACILEQDVHPHMQLETYDVTNSFVWTSIVMQGPGEGVHKWSVIFRDVSQRPKFLFELKRCMYEASTQMPFVNVKDDDRSFCLEANDFSMAVDEEEIYDPAVDFLAFDGLHIAENPQEQRRRLAEEEAAAAEASDDEDEPPAADGARSSAKGEHNSLLVDSARHKRTFVVRGNTIGVFDRDDDCRFATELPGITDLEGRPFTPSRVMLHHGDSHLIMLNPNAPNKMYPLDLETSKVVEEWHVDKDALLKVRNFTPSTKYGGVLEEPTLVSLTSNVVVGMDPRLSGASKAIGNPSDYVQTSNPNFTCCATTAKGHLAVGTARGEIKFFVGVPGMPHTTSTRVASCPKTARTVLPGLGDEIIGLDLTADGAWVLATCKGYLLVISTLTPNAKSNGFESRLGKDKPRPRRLCLAPEDQKLVGLQHSFTPASFNRGKGEMFIVTSMGEYIITWNFRGVQLGNARAYTMKRTGAQIMSEQFLAVLPDQAGHDVPIVLAHKDDVRVEKRRAYDRHPWFASSRPEFDRTNVQDKQ
eukprot:GGOE01018951.1.p1 GENE.GGOE01018951.1~~GGOE01018951.1.p1  ORF type:complete len:643 (-),score=215.47 GGOE01018951.1:177-2033(-)